MTFSTILKRLFTNNSLSSRVKTELARAEHLQLDLYTRIEECEVSMDYNKRALHICQDRIQRLKDALQAINSAE